MKRLRIRYHIAVNNHFINQLILKSMLKNIFPILSIPFVFSFKSEGQERRVLLQEKGITLIHYVDYNKPFKSYSGKEYSYTNLFCVEDGGKIDTISIGFANPIGKPSFNGTQLAFMTSEIGLPDYYYTIYEKVDGIWRKIIGHGTGSIYPNRKAELIIKSMFLIELKSEYYDRKTHHEVEFDMINRVIKRYSIDDDNNRKLDISIPFRKGQFPKFISRN